MKNLSYEAESQILRSNKPNIPKSWQNALKRLLHNYKSEQIYSRYSPFSASSILYAVWCSTGKAFSNRLFTSIGKSSTQLPKGGSVRC